MSMIIINFKPRSRSRFEVEVEDSYAHYAWA